MFNSRSIRTKETVLMPAISPIFEIDATGDVVSGDTIRFAEPVFAGSFRRPSYMGERIIEARVLRDSYGADRQQHTFTLCVLSSSGVEPLTTGRIIRRKGRNVYRNGTERMAWSDESARRAALAEKHSRGDTARAERATRLECELEP